MIEALSDSAISADLRAFGLDDPALLLSCHLMGPSQLADYAAGAPVITDDMPVLEHTAPAAVYVPGTVAANIGEMLQFRSPPPGAAALRGFDDAWTAVGLFYLAEASRDTMNLMVEANLLQQAVETCPRFLMARARLCASLHQSARILLESGESGMAWRALLSAVEVWPADPHALTDLAAMLNAQGRFDEAYRASGRALELEPGGVAALRARGRAALGMGLRDEAERALTTADRLWVD